jgi:hypothetical protein
VIPLHEGVRGEDFGKSVVEVLGLGEEEKSRVLSGLSERGSWLIK